MTPSVVDDSAVHMIRDNSKSSAAAVLPCLPKRSRASASSVSITEVLPHPSVLRLKWVWQTSCVSCGQCIAVCPTGALQEKSQVDEVLAAIADPSKHVIVRQPRLSALPWERNLAIPLAPMSRAKWHRPADAGFLDRVFYGLSAQPDHYGRSSRILRPCAE